MGEAERSQWRNQFKGDREFAWVDDSGTSLGLYRYVVLCEIVERASGDVVGNFTGSCSSMESKYIDRPRDSENTILKMAEKRALVARLSSPSASRISSRRTWRIWARPRLRA